MARTIEKQITINAPAAKVFEYVSDFMRHKEWGKHILDMRGESAGPVAVGSTFVHQARQLGKHSDRVTVTEFAPGSKIAFESQGDAGHIRHWFALRDEGDRTVLTKGVEPLKLAGAAKILAPFVAMNLPGALNKDLKAIKARVEGLA